MYVGWFAAFTFSTDTLASLLVGDVKHIDVNNWKEIYYINIILLLLDLLKGRLNFVSLDARFVLLRTLIQLMVSKMLCVFW